MDILFVSFVLLLCVVDWCVMEEVEMFFDYWYIWFNVFVEFVDLLVR